MPFEIIRDDITRVRADAVVNSANPKPVCGAGSDSAVYAAAGKEKLLRERQKIGEIRTGQAVQTPAFDLPAKYIIHTVGPVWNGGENGELSLLADCYRNSLNLAADLSCESIAFPLISTGVYGFPKDQALSVALREIRAFLEDHEMLVKLVVFDRTAYELSEDLVEGVNAFIDENYVQAAREKEYEGSYDERLLAARRRREEAFHSYAAELPDQGMTPFHDDKYLPSPQAKPSYQAAFPAQKPPENAPKGAAKGKKKPLSAPAGLSKKKKEPFQLQLGETFQERLFALIDERGLTDAEVYKRANLDRKLFSKIRCNPEYKPGKRTAAALAIALELNLDETVDLLGRAEMALSPSSRFDLIIEYCIEHEIYDIFEVNALLFEYDQQLLGA